MSLLNHTVIKIDIFSLLNHHTFQIIQFIKVNFSLHKSIKQIQTQQFISIQCVNCQSVNHKTSGFRLQWVNWKSHSRVWVSPVLTISTSDTWLRRWHTFKFWFRITTVCCAVTIKKTILKQVPNVNLSKIVNYKQKQHNALHNQSTYYPVTFTRMLQAGCV